MTVKMILKQPWTTPIPASSGPMFPGRSRSKAFRAERADIRVIVTVFTQKLNDDHPCELPPPGMTDRNGLASAVSTAVSAAQAPACERGIPGRRAAARIRHGPCGTCGGRAGAGLRPVLLVTLWPFEETAHGFPHGGVAEQIDMMDPAQPTA
jgi:hypothetical protein